MPYGNLLSAAALHPKLAHGGLEGCMNRAGRKNKARHDIVFVASVGRFLPRVEGEAIIAVPDVFDMGETGSIGVLNHDRFGKQFDCEHYAAPRDGVALHGKFQSETSRAATRSFSVHSVIEWQRYQKVTGDAAEPARPKKAKAVA